MLTIPETREPCALTFGLAGINIFCMKVNKWFLLFMAVCLVFSLAACGGGGGSDTTADNGGNGDDPAGGGNGGGPDGSDNGGSGEPVILPSENWLCFKANEDGCSISTTVVNGPLTVTPSLEYSKDRESWIPFTVGVDSVDLINTDDKVFIRATDSNVSFSESPSKYIRFVITGSVSASGNIMSLLDKNCGGTSVPNYAFCFLFAVNTTLTTAPDLPATTLATGCYAYMFINCFSLTAAPTLPAPTLATSCYIHMFEGCSKLKSITVHFATWSDIYTDHWVYGVGNTGIRQFHCRKGLNTASPGISRNPSGWTVIKDVPNPAP